jgi:hypothetical protein
VGSEILGVPDMEYSRRYKDNDEDLEETMAEGDV